MIDKIYRNAIIPAFETGLKRRKTFRFENDLRVSQWWTPQQLEQWQLSRLQELVNHCFQWSPYYRDVWQQYGLTPASLRSLEDFQQWPITTRETMRDCSASIRSIDPSVRFVRKSTGGSSGTPLRFVIDLESNDRRVAAANRGYGWAGAAPGTKQSYLWGVNLNDASRLGRWKEKVYSRYLYRRDVMNSFELTEESTGGFVRRINRFRPDVLVAYTNPLYQLAGAIDRAGMSVYQPRSIVVGAEKIHDFQRAAIERVFGAPVFETYGSREFTLIGAECDRHCGLHLSMENLIVEVVDGEGNPTPAGQEGQIVVTDLFNIAMPFLRYAIGDRGVAGFDHCECGRGLPLLKKVVGRQLDMIVTADGRHLAGEYFPHLLKDISSIRQFQVVQRERDLLELKVVVDDDWEDETKTSLEDSIQTAIGPSTRLRIDRVDRIPLTAAGKLRVVSGLPATELHQGQGEVA